MKRLRKPIDKNGEPRDKNREPRQHGKSTGSPDTSLGSPDKHRKPRPHEITAQEAHTPREPRLKDLEIKGDLEWVQFCCKNLMVWRVL